MHYPVMLSECLQYLAVKPEGIYLDATAGLGGHTGAIARQLTAGFVISADRDPESLERARANTTDVEGNIRFVNSRFSELAVALSRLGVEAVDGLLADLGVSRYQLTEAERGFSLMADGPLDMRMSRSEGTTAADLVNYASERDLADLIYRYGEERRARRIARAIVRARPIRSTSHLARVVEEAVPRTGPIHPATLTFMALRIAVNQEREEVESLLAALPDLVKPGGRVVVITFMSIEDRQVKQGFQQLARSGAVRILTKHVVKPSEEEIRSNPPSRSAKVR
ncbi:MAG TPA: 16S rRNA (cytosine(1402)-N(4))-methyltransferase RsmH, partial [Bryobacteraceae bacterium]|nr:16S rRNA (cytosine(1402)-N(4))-methyltransferase RsmH [Bryobacteraceae bacterium]